MIDIEIQISISERSSGWAINYISRCHAAASRVKRSKFDSNLCRRVPLKVKIWRIAWSIKSFAKIHKLPTQTNLVTFRWYFTLRKNQSSGGEVLMNRLNCTENYIFLKYVPKSSFFQGKWKYTEKNTFLEKYKFFLDLGQATIMRWRSIMLER